MSKPTPDKDWKKLPMDLNGEIDESLALLYLAQKLGDNEWVEELKEKLKDLVETMTFLSSQKKRLIQEGFYFEE